MQQVMYWQKGTVDICATSLVTGIMVNIIKNGNNETLSIFHVLYITRTHFSCRFRNQNMKSEIKYGICVKCYGLICVERQLVHMPFSYVHFYCTQLGRCYKGRIPEEFAARKAFSFLFFFDIFQVCKLCGTFSYIRNQQ